MTGYLTVALLASVVAGVCQEPPRDAAGSVQPHVLPFQVPTLPAMKTSAAVQQQVAALIDELPAIDKPDFGLSATLGGSSFPPARQGHFSVGLLFVDHGIEHHSAVLQLVELGPAALPALLDHLDDATPTKLIIHHEFGMGAMWYGTELPINAAVPLERDHALHTGLQDAGGLLDKSLEKQIHTHTVTVGDVCFVLMGMIANRPYSAVRYQPTACIVVNSPVHEPRIAQAVRTIWAAPDPRQRLLESLLADYHTRDRADSFQCGAATRLLYYFPAETAAAIARRMDDFHVVQSKHDGVDPKHAPGEQYMEQHNTNGVDATMFLEAVAGTTNALINAALLRVVERTDEPAVLNACISTTAVQLAADAVYNAMARMLKTPPAETQGSGPYGDPYNILLKGCTFFPERTPALFDTYAKFQPLMCKRACLRALAGAPAVLPWAARWLAPYLDDKTEITGWHYGPQYDEYPLRICDEAAEAVVRHLAGATFQEEGPHEHLNAQIAQIKRIINGESATAVYGPPAVETSAVIETLDPVKVIELTTNVSSIYPISDAKTIWAGYGAGYFKGTGYVYETWQIDAESGAVLKRIRLDTWKGHVDFIRPVGESIFCYHGSTGGDVVGRDPTTGAEQQRIKTPFHDGIKHDDPLQVRNLSDLAKTADNRWILAFTPDGVLHSIETSSGRHTTEWKRAAGTNFVNMGGLLAVRGRNQALLSTTAFGEDPLRLWDQDKREMVDLKRLPFTGWRGAWGNVAWNHMNNVATLWNLEKRERIRLPAFVEKAGEIVCDDRGTSLFALMADGSVEGVDLTSGRQTCHLRVPPSEEDKEITLSADGRWLFWHTSWHKSRGEEKPPPKKYLIAIFNVHGSKL